MRIRVKLPSCFVVRGLMCLVRPLFVMHLRVSMLVYLCFTNLLLFFFGVVKVRPKPKRQYHARLEKVKEYLETVKDFDELISPQSLFFHFLNPEPSNKVQRDNETIKKSKYINDIYIYIYI